MYEGAIGRAMAGTDPDFYFRIVTSRGVVKHLRGFAHRIADRPVFVGAVQDVTASKMAQEALNRAGAELAQVSRATTLSALTASIAHEVNQPLSGIITNAGTCLRMLDAAPPDIAGARETARRTIRDGNRASDVITRLRALFSKREFTLEPLDLNEATREVIALSSNDLQRNRIILQSELADDLPIVTGDRIQLQQVILNLLRNASDAMVDVHDRPRQLLIKTEREDGNRVRVTVRDAGMGLPPQSLDSLFEAFYTTKSGGMGIGLFVSRSIVERHAGASLGRAERWTRRHLLVFPSVSDGVIHEPGCRARRRIEAGAIPKSNGRSPARWRILIVMSKRCTGVGRRRRRVCPRVAARLAAAVGLCRPGVLIGGSVPRVRGRQRNQVSDPRHRDAWHVGPRSSTGTDTSAAGDSDCLHHRQRRRGPSVRGCSRSGAVECLFKPFSETALLDALNAALRMR